MIITIYDNFGRKKDAGMIFQRLFLIFIDSYSFISFQYQRIQRSSQQKPLSPLC